MQWLYWQWQPVAELVAYDYVGILMMWPQKYFTWGLDLLGLSGRTNSGPNPDREGAGSGLSAAGGIGGLLASYDLGADTIVSTGDDKSYAHFYDGNGNTGQLIQVSNNTLAAAYEYDAYGQVEAEIGAYAATNRMRFSTKPFDSETGLGYWGYRYYSARLGRWISRDPIDQVLTFRVNGIFDTPMGFVQNRPISLFDAVGQRTCCPQTCDDLCSTPGNPWGYSKCENGKFCTCICKDNMDKALDSPRGKESHQGVCPTAREWTWEGCGLCKDPPKGPNDQCHAAIVELHCYMQSVHRCDGDPQCLADLEHAVVTTPCESHCSLNSVAHCECLRYRAHRKVLRASGGTGDTADRPFDCSP